MASIQCRVLSGPVEEEGDPDGAILRMHKVRPQLHRSKVADGEPT